METTLKNICALHGLRGISANIFDAQGSNYITVYIHWTGFYETRHCESGMAHTFEDALALALAEKSKICSEAA